MPLDRDGALARLLDDGLVKRQGERLRTTAKWQGSMARAVLKLVNWGDSGEDLRVPVALAVTERYGDELDDEDLASLVAVLVPIEAAEFPAPAQT